MATFVVTTTGEKWIDGSTLVHYLERQAGVAVKDVTFTEGRLRVVVTAGAEPELLAGTVVSREPEQRYDVLSDKYLSNESE